MGYDMIGIDNSEEMLQIARGKKEKSGNEILYLLQDMRELELYGTVGAVVSVCDSLNYLLEEEDIIQVFRLVNNYLYPGGVFLFDFNTVYESAQIHYYVPLRSQCRGTYPLFFRYFLPFLPTRFLFLCETIFLR